MISGRSYMSKSILGSFQNCLWNSAGAAITVIVLIDQINVLNRVTSPHMISHSYVHPCTYEHACVCTHTHLTSLCGPPVRLGAPVPLWFSALWYHAGQIFLSAWMTPWHGVYLDWQLVFIWIDMQHREKKRLTEERSGHQERAPICPDMKNMGWQWTPGRGGGRQVHLLIAWMTSFKT